MRSFTLTLTSSSPPCVISKERCVHDGGGVGIDPDTPPTRTPVEDTKSPLCLRSPLSGDYHDNNHSKNGSRLIIQLHMVNYQ